MNKFEEVFFKKVKNKDVEAMKESEYKRGYEDGYCDAFIELFNERAKEVRDPEAYYAS